MDKILVNFEDIPVGCLCYANEKDQIALFERSDAKPSDTLWEGTKLWIIDWSKAPSWANSVAKCGYDDPITGHFKGKMFWMAATEKPKNGGTIGYFVRRSKEHLLYLLLVFSCASEFFILLLKFDMELVCEYYGYPLLLSLNNQ